MSNLLWKHGLIFACLTAGLGLLPVVAAAQASESSTTATTHKSTAHGKSGSSSAHASSSSAGKSPATKPASSTGKKPTTSHSKTASRRKRKPRGQDSPTPDRINEIQEALASKGAFSGTPTGKWDDSTVEAMKKFQSSHGLEPTGKLDAWTLQKLGLGSQTAGLAAPVAPANYVNRLHNTTSSPEEPRDNP